MITAITFQFTYNKKYLNDTDKKLGIGERSITDLQNAVFEDIGFLTSIHDLIYELNKDLERTDIVEVIAEKMGRHKPVINNKTKKIRTYFIGGLTIHEQDQN